MLLYKPYVLRCVLGGEIVALMCYLYGKTLADPLQVVHNQFWALFPGANAGGVTGVVAVVVTVAVLSAACGAYAVWMHNASLVTKK